MTLRHVVSWRLASEDAQEKAEHAAEVVRRLQALEGLIPGMLSLTVGANAYGPADNADIALVADFTDEAALEAYQVHPDHQAAAAYVRSVVAGRLAVDFDLS